MVFFQLMMRRVNIMGTISYTTVSSLLIGVCSIVSINAYAVGSNCNDATITIVNNSAAAVSIQNLQNVSGGLPIGGSIPAKTSQNGSEQSETWTVVQDQTSFAANIYFGDGSAYAHVYFHSLLGGCNIEPTNYSGDGLLISNTQGAQGTHVVTFTLTGAQTTS